MFLTPIVRAKLINPRIRLVAVRTLIASVIGLTVSAVNMAVLTALHGQELGWLCLACCSMDVVINVLALFWITDHRAMSNAYSASAAGTRDAAEQRRKRPATLDQAIQRSSGKILHQSKLGSDVLVAFDETTRTLAIVACEKVGPMAARKVCLLR